ncbi:membrane protein insertase YidC [Desulfovibrio litoralis]|uniref:Membrane protein insertase YidC n=1 Tax=Desulfovibrio litoralis DSM 11393 TaxID=1121455 RepID=A0A1M7RT72_9BACT|nr:membrane protein insertase YidC [Desulfovibrio litoralis]SHN49380.1 protein translocase subunit yidC [Desulfovibrio litoralis DSM 11393]
MDHYRTIAAVVLCVVVYFAWSYFADYMGWLPPPQTQQVQTQQAVNATATSGNQTAGAANISGIEVTSQELPNFVPVVGHDVVVETPYFRAVFHSGGGILKEFFLKKYPQTLSGNGLVEPLNAKSEKVSPLGLLINGTPTWNSGQWSSSVDKLDLQNGGTGTIEFVGKFGDINIVRTFTFNAETYFFDEKVTLTPTTSTGTGKVAFTIAASPMSSDGGKHDQDRIAYYNKFDSFAEESSVDTLKKGMAFSEGVYWGGIMSNYFLVATAPKDTSVVLKARYEDSIYRVALEKSDVALMPGVGTTIETSYYIGPKEKKYLIDAPNNLEAALDYGWFSIFSRPLVWTLNFLYKYVHNYGIAIILLTVLIKIIFWPLSHKSYKSMEKMKKLQPMMQKIREKYADDKEKMNAEVMQLYKTYKVNPASGCLPILIQIPVFFGLYRALLYSIELRHSSFIPHLPFTDIVWLADLSAKDPLMITPLVMGATMLIQQWITPTAGDPTQAKIMMLMPIVFTYIFIDFPSGLVLYWLVNNLISIGQQWYMLRKA